MNYAIQNTGALLGRKIVPTCSGSTTIQLEENELFRLDGDRRNMLVRVTDGRVWLTQSGDVRDILLEKGQTFQIDRRGLVLLEGLPAARVSFVLPRPI